MLRSKLEATVSDYLLGKGFKFEYEKSLVIKGRTVYPDFTLANGTLIEVAGFIINKESVASYKKKFRLILEETTQPLVILTYGSIVSAFEDLNTIRHVDIVSLDTKYIDTCTIHLDNVVIFDYSHALPTYKGKCSAIHSHSSLIVSASVTGMIDPKTQMVVDFGLVKTALKNISEEFDHHFVIDKKYLTLAEDGSAKIEYDTDKGKHLLMLPSCEVRGFETDPTVEMLSLYFAEKLLSQLPDNIFFVTVELSEGIGKSARSGYGKVDLEPSITDLAKILTYHENLV